MHLRLEWLGCGAAAMMSFARPRQEPMVSKWHPPAPFALLHHRLVQNRLWSFLGILEGGYNGGFMDTAKAA